MKVKVALDTNVLMDLLLEGRPEKESAEQIVAAAEAGLIEAQVSTQSIIDAAFTCRKQGVNREAFREAMAGKDFYLIDCMIDSDEKVWPMVAPGAPISDCFDENDRK